MREETLWRNIVEDIVARIKCDPYFGDVNVLYVDSGLSESEIESKQTRLSPKGKKLGLGILVYPPTDQVSDVDMIGPPRKVTMPVKVVERVNVNRSAQGTGISAGEAAYRLGRLLHSNYIAGEGIIWRTSAPGDAKDGDTVIDLTFEGRYKSSGAQTPQPRISITGGNVVLTCSDPLATIYYTLDESYPTPESTIYLAPFTLTTGVYIRAIAISPTLTKTPSNITEKTL